MFKKVYNYYKGRKILNELRKISNIIFNELFSVIETSLKEFQKEIDGYGYDNVIASIKNDSIKMECFIYIVWLYMGGNNFNTKYKKIIVDEIHNIFYRKSKEQGVSSKDIEFMVNTINSSYRLYNQGEESNDSLNIFIELIVKLEGDTLEFLHYDNDDDLMRKAYLEKFAKIFLKNAKEKIHEINDIKSSFQD